MKKTEDILKQSSLFMMKCEASVRSDMAKRIMHSILPSVADPAQVTTTKGVVDYKSLAAAAEGRHDIIKQGTFACIEELSSYKHRDYDNDDVYFKALNFAKSGDYWSAIIICINAFADNTGWMKGWGGEAWKKIAQTISKIIQLDAHLNKLRKNRTHPDFVDNEIDTLNDIVIYLNVFDGLAHNNGSIMGKLIAEEKKESEAKGFAYDDLAEEIAVKRLMDAKELENPVHVFKEIENTLKGTGDIYRWKDWTGKLTRQPDYRIDTDTHSVNMIRISFHKEIMEYIKKISLDLSKLEVALNSGAEAVALDNKVAVSRLMGEIMSTLYMIEQDAMYAYEKEEHSDAIKKFFYEVYELIDNSYSKLDELRDMLDDPNNKNTESLLNYIRLFYQKAALIIQSLEKL
jgi:hypothetical protein